MDSILVAIHVPAGVVAVASGIGAMLAQKGGRIHRRCGRIYLASLVVVCVSAVGLALTRGPGFLHLLALGGVSAVVAAAGYTVRRRADASLHVLCMAASYVAMLTAFYVDNGPKLPLWNRLPPVAFWFLPSLVGAPLTLLALRRRARAMRGYGTRPSSG